MAFALSRIFPRKPVSPIPGTYAAAKPKPKPSYSPQTEQEITRAMVGLALKGPRWIGEQMGEDLDEAFEVGDTRVSVTQFIRHPIKTTKSVLRKWTVGKWKNAIRAELVAEYVWRPRLEGILEVEQGRREGLEEAMRRETDPARWRQMRDQLRQLPETYQESADKILEWVSNPEGYGRDVAFEGLEELRSRGNIGDEVWQGIRRQHSWDEISRFRRRPGRYLWEKTFGMRGEKGVGPLYKLSPQKWLGESLGKALGKTAAGKAVASVKQVAKQAVQKAVLVSKEALKVAAKATASVAKKVIIKIFGQATWTTISSAIGGALGSVVPGAGTAAGAVVGLAIGIVLDILEKAVKLAAKMVLLGCGCLAMFMAGFLGFLMVVVMAAFRPPATGGTGPEQLVEVRKTVSPTHIDLGATGAEAEVVYTIEVINKTDKEITDGTLVDTHKPDDFLISVWAEGDWVAGVGTWSNITIPPNGSFSKRPRGFIQGTNVDKVVVNNVSFTGTIDGDSVSAGGSAVVIVGNPSGQPPSGWPTAKGCVTQGPGGSFSHAGEEAIDVGKLDGEASESYKIYATHDGVAYAWTQGNGPFSSACGKYVEVVSHGGTFRTYYCHLFSHSVAAGGVAVGRGAELGVMGNTGSGDGGLHVHYEFRGTYNSSDLEMKPPYIPADVGPCSGDCNCCFSGFDGACGSAP